MFDHGFRVATLKVSPPLPWRLSDSATQGCQTGLWVGQVRVAMTLLHAAGVSEGRQESNTIAPIVKRDSFLWVLLSSIIASSLLHPFTHSPYEERKEIIHSGARRTFSYLISFALFPARSNLMHLNIFVMRDLDYFLYPSSSSIVSSQYQQKNPLLHSSTPLQISQGIERKMPNLLKVLTFNTSSLQSALFLCVWAFFS